MLVHGHVKQAGIADPLGEFPPARVYALANLIENLHRRRHFPQAGTDLVRTFVDIKELAHAVTHAVAHLDGHNELQSPSLDGVSVPLLELECLNLAEVPRQGEVVGSAAKLKPRKRSTRAHLGALHAVHLAHAVAAQQWWRQIVWKSDHYDP